MSRRHVFGVGIAPLVVVAAMLSSAACSTTLHGRAVSVFDDPFRVAGMEATDGPTGLRADAAKPTREASGSDGGDIDALAAAAVSDIEEYWDHAFPETFSGHRFTPIGKLVSWDSREFDGMFCGMDTIDLVNAGFCVADNTIGWDRGDLLPTLHATNGDMGVAMVLAHEYGHTIVRQAGLNGPNTPVLVSEQQADCLAGAYMRWVAEGSSRRFTLSTGDGLNSVLAALIGFRDPLFSAGDLLTSIDEHGSAFERVSALQFGFTDGPAACAAIDLREIGQRRGDLPVLLPEDQTGELPVTEESVRSVVDALTAAFRPARPPGLDFTAQNAQTCADARPSPPVSYCPATDTLVVDLTELQVLGAPQEDVDTNGLATGDNTAYSVLMSRYLQAVQRERGLVLDTAEAALRTACLTGVATRNLSRDTGPDANGIVLTAGDLDEAVSGILTNGLAASDVNGESVPSGFSRIDAFRVGVLGDEQRCLDRFP